jgi:hypothetical protein
MFVFKKKRKVRLTNAQNETFVDTNLLKQWIITHLEKRILQQLILMARFKIKHFKVHLRIEIIRHGFANIMLRLFPETYLLLSESQNRFC